VADRSTIRRILWQQCQSWEKAGLKVVPRQLPVPLKQPPTEQDIVEPKITEAVPPKTQPAEAPSQPMPKPVKNPLPVLSKEPKENWPEEYSNLSADQRGKLLNELQQQVANCRLCQELAEARTQTVFGVGSPKARICFFGEAPGADEDRQGEPFVGRAGKLLTQIIQACGFEREDVYILNTLKCRPPGNRNPTQTENENCRPYFERQLEIIQPEYIVCLGRFAITNLLDTTAAIGKLRGKFHDYRSSKVIVTYHPAYLLRNPSAKKDVWDDMKMMLKDMGLPIPKKK